MSRVTETVMRKHYAAFFMRDGVRRLSSPAYVEMDHPRADISVDKVRRFPRDTFLSCIYSVKKKQDSRFSSASLVRSRDGFETTRSISWGSHLPVKREFEEKALRVDVSYTGRSQETSARRLPREVTEFDYRHDQTQLQNSNCSAQTKANRHRTESDLIPKPGTDFQGRFEGVFCFLPEKRDVNLDHPILFATVKVYRPLAWHGRVQGTGRHSHPSTVRNLC